MFSTARTNSARSESLSRAIFHLREHLHVVAELEAIDDDHLRLDVALLAHALDAPPARRLRQADALGELGRGQRRVLLHEVQDLEVDGIEFGGHSLCSRRLKGV